jgi:capsular exopolysaccharide synthesis family protein
MKRRRHDSRPRPEDELDPPGPSLSFEVEPAIVSPTLIDQFPREDSGDAGEAAAAWPVNRGWFPEAPSAPEQPPGTMAVFHGFTHAIAGKVVSSPRMDPGSAEQYRRLAAALHHVQVDRGHKKVMVTSAVEGEGKTLTALNLALTLSESYRRRVLVVDAHLRCPRIHELLDIVNVTGLGEALKDTSQNRLTLVQVSPRLSVLPAGRPDPDPMGALTSQRMGLILDEAAANFDWVIVDTPPVGLLPDTNLLATKIDVAIVVIQAGRTAYDLVDRAVQAVGRQRVLGVVLNDVRDKTA